MPHILCRTLCLCVTLLVVTPTTSWAQDDCQGDENTRPPNCLPLEAPLAEGEEEELDWDIFVLPVVAFTPETSFIFGAAGAVAIKNTKVDKPLQSSATADATYTLRNQWGVRLSGSFYLNRDTYLVETDLGVFNWKDFYFGVGDDPEAPDQGRVFSYYEGRAEVAVLRRVFLRTLYAGLIFRTNGISVRDSESAELTSLTGGDGGNTFGLGAQVVWDGRDRSFWTQRGTYLRANIVHHNDAVLSDFTLTEADLDARGFLPLGAGFVLGGQVRTIIRAGDVPYFRQATIGGSTRLRGTFNGRFRDNIGAWTQAEVRTPYVWDFAFAAFGGAGLVAPNLSQVTDVSPIYVGGAGLRYGVTDDGVNIRADFGFGPDGETGFYLGLGEAF